MAKLLDVLNRLVDLGNTVVVIEHNLDVIKTADWIIDMGPEAGEGGGWLVAEGTPEEVVAGQGSGAGGRGAGGAASCGTGKRSLPVPASLATSALPLMHRSHTAEALAPILAAGPHVERRPHDFAAAEARRGRMSKSTKSANRP